MNTEQLKTDRTAIEILRFRMVERLRIDQPSWTEELCSKKVNDFLDEEDPNFGECFTTAMQDFASQESKRAVEKDRESRWISIDSAQPEALTWVMVWVQSRNMSFMVSYRAYPKDGSMWDDYQKHGLDPSEFKVWQPLPEPPK